VQPTDPNPAATVLPLGDGVYAQGLGPARTRIEVLEPAGHPSGGSHTASASESVSVANTRSGETLMTRTAVSVRLIAGAPVALVDHARAERPGLDQV
jgi:hypothetical protein